MWFKKNSANAQRITGGPRESISISSILEAYEEGLIDPKGLFKKDADLAFLRNMNPAVRNEFIKKAHGEGDVYAVFVRHSDQTDVKSLVISSYIYEKTMSFIVDGGSDVQTLTNFCVGLPNFMDSLPEQQMITTLVEPLLSDRSSNFNQVFRFFGYQIVDIQS